MDGWSGPSEQVRGQASPTMTMEDAGRPHLLHLPMPQAIIIAGPNGAGKTSFANEYLLVFRRRFVFINADEIAREIIDPGLSEAMRDLRAGREMLTRIRDCVDAGVNFLFETTLATLTYAGKIPRWRGEGYSVGLVYLRLADVQISLDRIRRRVAAEKWDD
jgi:predicted ABC-type ATPase